jgi:hypothetical protein
MRLKILWTFSLFFLLPCSVVFSLPNTSQGLIDYKNSYNSEQQNIIREKYNSNCEIVRYYKQIKFTSFLDRVLISSKQQFIDQFQAIHVGDEYEYDTFDDPTSTNPDHIILVQICIGHVVVEILPATDFDSDGDGVSDCHDQCPNTPSNVAVDSQGCPDPCVDNDGDGIPYAFDFGQGLIEDYNFKIGRTTNDSYVTLYIPEKDKLYTYGEKSDLDIMIIDTKTYHSSDLSWLLDCQNVTFNPNQPQDPILKNDFKKDLEEEKYRPENETPSDSGVDKPSDPEIDIPAGEEGNYATRSDASAIEKAMKENTNISRQSSSATRKKIDELIQSGNKNKNDIVDAINNIDVDIDEEEIGNQVSTKNDEKYRAFSDEQSAEIDSESQNIPQDSSDFFDKTGINPDDPDSIHSFSQNKINSVMAEQDSTLTDEEKNQLDSQIQEIREKADFDKFTINLNSSSCTFDADLGAMGVYTISICEYESELRFVGNVFFFAFALCGYVVLLRS